MAQMLQIGYRARRAHSTELTCVTVMRPEELQDVGLVFNYSHSDIFQIDSRNAFSCREGPHPCRRRRAMRQDSQFGRLYQERVIQLQGGHEPSDRRWEVWKVQQQMGLGPCFATETRYACQALSCPWRTECQSLCVEWRR
mgnify:CR=1 FL=1